MGRKLGLQRDQVVTAAATLADSEGLEQVTLARVAAALDVRSPSLYTHVEGLDGLRRALAIDGAGQLAEAVAHTLRGRAGEDALRALAYAYRRFAAEHPGLYAAILSTPAPADDPAVYAALAAPVAVIAGLLDTLGVEQADAIPLIRTFRSALHGFVALEAGGGFGMPADIDASFDVLVDVVVSGILARSSGR